MEKIRTFIAINLDPEMKKYLTSLQNNLNVPESKIKWVEKNNLHITIKFLGFISLKQIELIKAGLKEITNQYNPFLIQLSSDIGVFPNYKMPRIIWVGIREGMNELKELYNYIEVNLFKKGFPRENKDFSNHITIGRVKSIKDKNNFIPLLKSINIKTLSQKVNSIEIMESKLTPNGPIYNITAKFPLLKQ
ncbi:MAG: RNA 2',3'-cyclic phosphodiesterase [Candidatus Atribacteria bacterium]|nr:RNA 2',3'-cyclic phosphodiesterase [Candidatus Atribacteria bacterium]